MSSFWFLVNNLNLISAQSRGICKCLRSMAWQLQRMEILLRNVVAMESALSRMNVTENFPFDDIDTFLKLMCEQEVVAERREKLRLLTLALSLCRHIVSSLPCLIVDCWNALTRRLELHTIIGQRQERRRHRKHRRWPFGHCWAGGGRGHSRHTGHSRAATIVERQDERRCSAEGSGPLKPDFL